MGYVLRLTELNRYPKPYWILKKAGICKRFRFVYPFVFNKTLDLSPLARLTGIGEEILSILSYQPITSLGGEDSGYLVFGSVVPQHFIRPNQNKICPSCLQESNYIRKIWELVPVTACPIHKCLLVEECPNCLKHITWTRSGVSICQCEFDWRQYSQSSVETSELKVSRQIHALCDSSIPLDNTTSSSDSNPLYTLKLRELLLAISFIARQYNGNRKIKPLFSSMSNKGLHDLFCRSWAVFEDWPKNFFAFLDWRREQIKESNSIRGIRKDFAEYKFHLYQHALSNQLNFMKGTFDEYLATTWDGGYSSHVKHLSENVRLKEKYVSKRVAMKLLKIAVQGVDGFIASGRLRAVIRQEGKRRMVLINKDTLHKFKQVFDRSLYLKQVANILGLPNYRVLELIDCGLLNPLRGPNVDGTSDWRFDEDELFSLLNSIRKKIKPVAQSLGHNTISFLGAVRKLSSVDVEVLNILCK